MGANLNKKTSIIKIKLGFLSVVIRFLEKISIRT